MAQKLLENVKILILCEGLTDARFFQWLFEACCPEKTCQKVDGIKNATWKSVDCHFCSVGGEKNLNNTLQLVLGLLSNPNDLTLTHVSVIRDQDKESPEKLLEEFRKLFAENLQPYRGIGWVEAENLCEIQANVLHTLKYRGNGSLSNDFKLTVGLFCIQGTTATTSYTDLEGLLLNALSSEYEKAYSFMNERWQEIVRHEQCPDIIGDDRHKSPCHKQTWQRLQASLTDFSRIIQANKQEYSVIYDKNATVLKPFVELFQQLMQENATK
ncbi:MAG: hypothetical protein ACKO37_02420 [Vampirovibrionales bacterium]